MNTAISTPVVSAPVCLADDRNTRRRERTITDSEIESLIAETVELAATTGRVSVDVIHGGSVPNAYKYPAVTQFCAVVAGPDGRCCWKAGEIAANKVTHAGCVGWLSEGLRPLFDGRYGSAAKAEAAEFAGELLNRHCG